MTKDAKLYVNTDIDIIITIDNSENEVGDVDLLLTDIVDMSVVLTLAGNPGVTFIFTGDNVAVGSTQIVLSIPKLDGITVPGVYDVRVEFTDTIGKERGLTPSPDFLEFHA